MKSAISRNSTTQNWKQCTRTSRTGRKPEQHFMLIKAQHDHSHSVPRKCFKVSKRWSGKMFCREVNNADLSHLSSQQK